MSFSEREPDMKIKTESDEETYLMLNSAISTDTHKHPPTFIHRETERKMRE